jgi:hypothetical protein
MATNDDGGRSGITRRTLLQRIALLLLGAPLLPLSETVARAERRRRHHRGDTSGIWIGHC